MVGLLVRAADMTEIGTDGDHETYVVVRHVYDRVEADEGRVGLQIIYRVRIHQRLGVFIHAEVSALVFLPESLCSTGSSSGSKQYSLRRTGWFWLYLSPDAPSFPTSLPGLLVHARRTASLTPGPSEVRVSAKKGFYKQLIFLVGKKHKPPVPPPPPALFYFS